MITEQMQGYFRLQGEAVLARFWEQAPRIEAQYAGWSTKKVQKHLADTKGIDEINIDKAAEIRVLILMLEPYISSLLQEEGERILRELGVGVLFSANDPKTLKWLGKRMDMFSKEVTGTTFDAVKAILREGFSQGLPTSTIADQLRATFTTAEKYRAPLIARTETVAAMNQADLLAIEQAKIEALLLKQWISAGDEATRPTHLKAEQDYAEGIPIKELFKVGGDRMAAPGNGTDPAENVNCRCCVGYVRKQ